MKPIDTIWGEKKMGEVAEMILDGALCQICGGLVYEGNPDDATEEEFSPGYPRTCEECEDCED